MSLVEEIMDPKWQLTYTVHRLQAGTPDRSVSVVGELYGQKFSVIL